MQSESILSFIIASWIIIFMVDNYLRPRLGITSCGVKVGAKELHAPEGLSDTRETATSSFDGPMNIWMEGWKERF
jgi:hypothetical protein